jgi:hypothetical protein
MLIYIQELYVNTYQLNVKDHMTMKHDKLEVMKDTKLKQQYGYMEIYIVSNNIYNLSFQYVIEK